MAIQTATVSIGTTTPVLLAQAIKTPVSVVLGIEGGTTAIDNVYIGGTSSLTVATGAPVSILPAQSSGQPGPIDLLPGDALYAISASGTIDSFVITFGA